MQHEAEITVNGAKLTDTESRMIRLALESLADILSNSPEEDGISLTDQYQADVARVQSLIEGKAQRPQ